MDETYGVRAAIGVVRIGGRASVLFTVFSPPPRLRSIDVPAGPAVSLEGSTYRMLVATIAILNILGVVMVLSASSVTSLVQHGSAYYYFQRQLLWTALGVVGAAMHEHAAANDAIAPLTVATLLGVPGALLFLVIMIAVVLSTGDSTDSTPRQKRRLVTSPIACARS